MTRFGIALAWQMGRVRAVLTVLLVVTLGLQTAPQAQDVLVMLGQGNARLSWMLLATSVSWLGVNTWFWSRFLLLTRAPPGDTVGPQQHSRQRLTQWLPRLLGLIPFLAVATAMITASHDIPQGMRNMMGAEQSGAQALERGAALIVLLGLVVFGFFGVVQRRISRNRIAGFVFLAASLLVGVAGVALYGFAPVAAGKLFQPAPTILFAAAALIAGGTIITWFGARTRLPAMPIVLVFAFALAELRDGGVLPDNHDVRATQAPLPAPHGYRRGLPAISRSQ